MKKQTKKVQSAQHLPLGDKFCKWLLDNDVNPDSIPSYVSYINGLNKNFLRKISPSGKSVIDEYLRAPDDLFETVMRKYLGLIAVEAAKQGIDGKTISNYQSGFYKYIEYLFPRHEPDRARKAIGKEEGRAVDNSLTIDNFLRKDQKEASLTYSGNWVRSNFVFRLTTQNRLNSKDDALLPLSLIRTVFTAAKRNKREDNWLDKWARRCYADIIVLTNNSQIKMKSVKAVLINTENGQVKVRTKKGDEVVYTHNADGTKREMAVAHIDEIHIDHKEAIDGILDAKAEEFKALQRITKMLHGVETEKMKLNANNKTELGNAVRQKHMDELLEMIPEIQKDLDLICKYQQQQGLELMDGKENSKKSNKDYPVG